MPANICVAAIGGAKANHLRQGHRWIFVVPMTSRDTAAENATADAGAHQAAAQCEAGHRYLQSGQPLEAQLCCERALASNPNHAGALYLMGLIASRAGEHDHALEWTVRAIAQEPRPEFLAGL